MCRRVLVLVVVAVAFRIPSAWAQWEKLTESYSGANYRMASIGPNLFSVAGSTIQFSKDSGAHWRKVNGNSSASGTINTLTANKTNLFVGTTNGVVVFSPDADTSWIASNIGLPSHVFIS